MKWTPGFSARIKTRLRRTPSADETDAETLRIGDLAISVDGHSVKRENNPIQLTPLEFDLLLALARRPRQVFTREVLLEQVWGYRHAADTRLVNVHVQRLRSKIERDPEHPEIGDRESPAGVLLGCELALTRAAGELAGAAGDFPELQTVGV